MALVDSVLSGNLLSLFNEMKETHITEKDYADRLASIIDTQIKTANVTVAAGIAVGTSSGAGSTTSPGKGTIS